MRGRRRKRHPEAKRVWVYNILEVRKVKGYSEAAPLWWLVQLLLYSEQEATWQCVEERCNGNKKQALWCYTIEWLVNFHNNSAWGSLIGHVKTSSVTYIGLVIRIAWVFNLAVVKFSTVYVLIKNMVMSSSIVSEPGHISMTNGRSECGLKFQIKPICGRFKSCFRASTWLKWSMTVPAVYHLPATKVVSN